MSDDKIVPADPSAAASLAAPIEPADAASIIPLNLDDVARRLIRLACPGAVVIQVGPLDKGLSGASVWLSEWTMNHGIRSAPHVLKLDNYSKLEAEKERVEHYVAPVDPLTGHIRLFGPFPDASGNAKGLLRQAYIGNSPLGPVSLRGWLQQQMSGPTDIIDRAAKTRRKIEELYTQRMRLWHGNGKSNPSRKDGTIRAEIDRRLKHFGKLRTMMDVLGVESLERSFERRGLPSLAETERKIEQVLDQHETFSYGLIHGDLHSQNVLVDDHDDLHLIDFAWSGYGWRALDFLMLECSLKFLLAPNDAEIDDLLEMERLLDGEHDPNAAFSEMSNRLCGSELRVVASGIAEIRRAAMDLGAINDLEQYRRGILAMSSVLGAFPQLHRGFLAHSLAYHVGRIR